MNETATRREVIIQSKYTREQIYQLFAASIFLTGAVFMLAYTFANLAWAFWVGLGFAIVASVLYALSVFEARRAITKKLVGSPSIAAVQTEPETAPAKAEPVQTENTNHESTKEHAKKNTPAVKETKKK